jgi:DNA replication protein DnaC
VLATDRDAHCLADHLVRVDLVILDELGYLPFPISGGQMWNRRERSPEVSAPR